jgi:CubicO group peptidase (beta-lactamase class C family)
MATPLPPTGLAFAVYTPAGTHTAAFGVADANSNAMVTADTAFYLASSAKSFTGLAMSALASRGELNLDMPLNQFAPEAGFPDAVRPGEVTLRHLLAHSHGIRNHALWFRLGATGQHDADTLWGLLASSIVNEDAPLGQFRYGNVGYNMLTVLTDRMLATRWQELVQREVLAPVGMTHAATAISDVRWPIAAPHYSAAPVGQTRLYLEKSDATMHSAGGVVVSANDAARWLELMINDGQVQGRQVVAAEAVRQTRAPLVSTGSTFGRYSRDHYGLGWHIGRYRDDVLVHHFGASSGARVHVSYMPARRVGVAVLINDNAPIAEAADALANFIYDHLAGRADADRTYASELRRHARAQQSEAANIIRDRAARARRQWTLTRPPGAYAGLYEHPDWGTIEVREEGQRLRMIYGVLSATGEPFTAPDTMRVELQPLDGDVVQFAFGDGDTPVGLDYGGQRYVRRR